MAWMNHSNSEAPTLDLCVYRVPLAIRAAEAWAENQSTAPVNVPPNLFHLKIEPLHVKEIVPTLT